MKHFLPLVLILASGCSTMQSNPVVPHITHPAISLTTTPYIEYMGDNQIQGLVAFANNPMWKCTTCAQGQLSSQVLAEVPEVIALHPNIVVIQTGAYDLLADPEHGTATLYPNVQQMVDAFVAAKITVVVSMLPGSTLYDDYYFNEGVDLENQAGMIPDVFTFNFTSGDLLTSGVDYSQAGLAEVYPAFYQQIQRFQLGGTK